MAAARLEKAKQRLTIEAPVPRPRATRTTVSRTDAGTLLLRVPAAGLNTGTLMGGAFTAAWFSVVVPATTSMIASGGASALFMLPFWLAGGTVAKQTVLDPTKATALSIGEYAWELRQTTLASKVTLSFAEGTTADLGGADVDVAAYVNGVPSYVLRLGVGTRSYDLGVGLEVAELEWLAAEVNEHLRMLAERTPELGDS